MVNCYRDQDTSLTIDASKLLANDTDADGDTLTISSVQDATHGTVSLDTNGNVVFTPEDNYTGEATFTYTVSDGQGGSDTASVTVNVTGSDEVVVDDRAEAPTLSMNISDAEVVTSTQANTSIEINTDGATNKGEGQTAWDEIEGTSGNDKIIAGDEYDKIALRNGNNTLQAGDGDSSDWSKVSAGSGKDNIVVGDNWEEISTGSGDDMLQAGNGLQKINLESGNDTAILGDSSVNQWSKVYAGSGNDNIIAGNNHNEIILGSGDDILNIGNNTDSEWSKIQGNDGNDAMTAGYGYDVIDGGAGNDTVTFKGDASEWTVGERWGHTIVTHNATGDITQVDNVENIEFGGVDAQVGTATTTYEYNITLHAGLTDTDGSESLSNITLTNLPEGTTISGIEANADGSYTVAVDENGDVSVTLVSSAQLDDESLNNITASVTATESNGGDRVTTSITTETDEHIDGFEGFDTLVFDQSMNLDLGNIVNNLDNIESLELGDGTQEVSISLSDVMEITDSDNMLRIDGDFTDSVTLETDSNGDGNADTTWTLGDFKTDAETGATYQEYNGQADDGNSVTVEISTQVQVDQH
ncbi:MAG: cadherin-like domain-containing protein [Campylobacterales bacterium]|nr:cadherin-like domain-containing protein [Campylobacterales bacterium]